MREGWRWFGPNDPVTLDHVRQSGARHVVSALHETPIGEGWTRKAIAARKALIESAPAGRAALEWSVIESIPVPDDIKRNGAAAKASIAAWIASLEAAAAEGLKIICYNFMPLIDWARTDLDHPLPTGATALRFSQDRYAAFDLFILKRDDARYDDDAYARAKAAYEAMTPEGVAALTHALASALPGSTTEAMTAETFRERLKAYRGIDAPRLRANLIGFLQAVLPAAEAAGVTLTLHPDDPPRPLFGMPRVASTESDFAAAFEAAPSRANGLCFCAGALGARADNDLPAMARRFGDRIAFAHLRAVKREPDGLSFHEADHLDGDVDMIGVVRALMAAEASRPAHEKIIFRPDHGQRMLGDLETERVTPGYAAVGRLKGLAELRGVMRALAA